MLNGNRWGEHTLLYRMYRLLQRWKHIALGELLLLRVLTSQPPPSGTVLSELLVYLRLRRGALERLRSVRPAWERAAFRDAARLCRAAEALARSAVATLATAGDGPATPKPEEQGKAQAEPEAARRRRWRRRGRRAKTRRWRRTSSTTSGPTARGDRRLQPRGLAPAKLDAPQGNL